MGKKSSCKRFKAFVTVLSQNMRGLKTAESITELIDVLEQRRAFAFLAKHLSMRKIFSSRHAPINATNIIPGLILANFGKIDASALLFR